MARTERRAPVALAPPLLPAGGPVRRVVHLVGRCDDEVLAFMRPALQALQSLGEPGSVQQTVIVSDTPRHRHLLPQFDPWVRLVLVADDHGPVYRTTALLRQLFDEANRPSVVAVHLHGVVACLIGGYAARFRRLPVPLYFSPHGTSRGRVVQRAAAVLLWMLRPRVGEPPRRTITSHAAEVDTLRLITGQPVDLVEAGASETFFAVRRREARRPLVVTACRTGDPDAAARFAQLAVLLSDEALGLGFNWIGPADAESQARLRAADVGQFDPPDDPGRVARLAAGWIYVAPGGGGGLPVCLVEAMAMGLPCVAWATPSHEAVLQDGATGLLCHNEAELLSCVARLVDSADYRQRLGRAAREAARERFHLNRVKSSLWASYEAPLSGPMPLDGLSGHDGLLTQDDSGPDTVPLAHGMPQQG